MTITADSLVAQSGEPMAARVDNELVLLSAATGTYYGFSELGSEVWSRIAAPTRISRLCAALSAEFDADVETIMRDVLPFLGQLAEHQLIEVNE